MADAEQIVCATGSATAFGTGLTTTEAVIGVPMQVVPAFVKLGMIVKVTVTGKLVVFVNVPLILPVPFAAIPVAEAKLSLVQLKTVPTTLPVRAIFVMADAEQMVCAAGRATAFGIGLTIIVAVIGIPVQVAPALV